MKRRDYLAAAGSVAGLGLAGCLGGDDEGSNDNQDINGEQDDLSEDNGTERVFTAARSDRISDLIRVKGGEVAESRHELKDLKEEREDSEYLPPAENFSWGNRQAFSPTESTVFYNFSGDESTQLETQGNIYKSAPGVEPFGSGERSVESAIAPALTDLGLFDTWRSANNFVDYDLEDDNAFQNLRDFIPNIRNTQPYFQHFGDDEELTVPEDFDRDVVDDLERVLNQIEDIEKGYRDLVTEVASLNDEVDEGVDYFLDALDNEFEEGANTDDRVREDEANEYVRGLNNLEQGVDSLYADVLSDAAEVILTKRLYKDAQDQAKEVLEDLEQDPDNGDNGNSNGDNGDNDNGDDNEDDDIPDNDPDPEPPENYHDPEYKVKERLIQNEDKVFDDLVDEHDGKLDEYDIDDLTENLEEELKEEFGENYTSEQLINGETDPYDIIDFWVEWGQSGFGQIKDVRIKYTIKLDEGDGITSKRVPLDNSYTDLPDDFGEALVEYFEDENIQ